MLIPRMSGSIFLIVGHGTDRWDWLAIYVILFNVRISPAARQDQVVCVAKRCVD